MIVLPMSIVVLSNIELTNGGKRELTNGRSRELTNCSSRELMNGSNREKANGSNRELTNGSNILTQLLHIKDTVLTQQALYQQNSMVE